MTVFGQPPYCQCILLMDAVATKDYTGEDKKELCIVISLFHSNRLETLHLHRQGPIVSI